ncbi:YqgE/AlgH family protein [Aeoliella mucimassa]|uniref:Uncharacterized protein n=1 Tax=Aeoliella mucimassa TaxID=2527972 RepID=A0A518AMP9_9BACT|nr:YqgE/AlgH family protein [Aeoliella mucimassa]QDU56005.1 hypothetical protein Pan181_22070 [Aeoliella mucimassa]
MESIAGKLLVASRELRDPNFTQSVVMMIEHSPEGALGVILNHPSTTSVSEAWAQIDGGELEDDTPVFVGGPVPGPLIALHAIEDLGEKEVLPGVFMSVQRDVIEKLVLAPDTRLRLYSGHSGWGAGQLEDEMKAGGWHIVSAEPGDVFADQEQTEDLWQYVLERMAIDIMLPGVPHNKLPRDPNMN